MGMLKKIINFLLKCKTFIKGDEYTQRVFRVYAPNPNHLNYQRLSKFAMRRLVIA